MFAIDKKFENIIQKEILEFYSEEDIQKMRNLAQKANQKLSAKEVKEQVGIL